MTCIVWNDVAAHLQAWDHLAQSLVHFCCVLSWPLHPYLAQKHDLSQHPAHTKVQNIVPQRKCVIEERGKMSALLRCKFQPDGTRRPHNEKLSTLQVHLLVPTTHLTPPQSPLRLCHSHLRPTTRHVEYKVTQQDLKWNLELRYECLSLGQVKIVVSQPPSCFWDHIGCLKL